VLFDRSQDTEPTPINTVCSANGRISDKGGDMFPFDVGKGGSALPALSR